VEEFLTAVDVSDAHWIKDVLQQKNSVKIQMKTALVALHNETSTIEKSPHITSSLFVQYFASGNYGFVKCLNGPGQDGNDCLLQLMKKAISVLNQVSFCIFTCKTCCMYVCYVQKRVGLGYMSGALTWAGVGGKVGREVEPRGKEGVGGVRVGGKEIVGNEILMVAAIETQQKNYTTFDLQYLIQQMRKKTSSTGSQQNGQEPAQIFEGYRKQEV